MESYPYPFSVRFIGQEDRTTLGRGVVTGEVLEKLGRYRELGKAAARDIPNSRLIELPNVGHIPHFEAPERFHSALLAFLNILSFDFAF